MALWRPSTSERIDAFVYNYYLEIFHVELKLLSSTFDRFRVYIKLYEPFRFSFFISWVLLVTPICIELSSILV